jgi:anthranilate phosphoribosyltransferase
MRTIMAGDATPSQIAAFLISYKSRHPSAEELAGMAEAMLEAADTVDLGSGLLDTCGTGGDRSGTINASTIAAFVAAGAGAKVAKHGNRAASSKCGSADLLEAMGVVIDLGPDEVRYCFERAGICFLFARRFHPAMRHVAPVRQELGIPTVMNLLGPLCNPAGAEFHAMGVADPGTAKLLAETMALLGRKRALLFHGQDGIDELSVTSPSTIYEVVGQEIKSFDIHPEDLGIGIHPLEAILGDSPDKNREIAERVLSGDSSPAADFVALNAAAALVACDLASSLAEGVEIARESLAEGKAAEAAEALVESSRAAATR